MQRAIARGAAASVWLARDTRTQTDVILKKLEPASVRDPLMRRRVEVEARASDAISHPGTVPVIDRLLGENDVALVFPYVPGQTLRERLSADGRLEARTSAEAASELADVLSAAHAAGIIHRDVKPANILLANDGQVRLLDFGIARFVDTEGNDETSPAAMELTGSGMAIGTLPYMAPEQLTGRPASPKTDVYALGVVLYESLSGSRPYTARSPSEQLALLQDAPPMIPDVPEALFTLALQAMSVRPEQRPTAEQFGRALRGWLDGRHDAESATAVVAAAAATPMVQPVQAVAAPLLQGATQPPGALARVARPIAAVIAGLILVVAAGVALAFIPGLRSGAAPGFSEPPATVLSQPVVAPASRNPAEGNGGTDIGDGRNEPNQGDDGKDDKDGQDKGPDEPGPDHKDHPHGGNGAPGGGNGNVGGGNGNVGGGNGGVGAGNGSEGHPPDGED